MAKKTTNAIKGKQGFQPTGRTDPLPAPGADTGVMGKFRKLLGIQQPARFVEGDIQAPRDSYAAQHESWRRVTSEQPEANWLRDDERDAVWNDTFHRHEQYGTPRRFDIHENPHEQIANFVDLIRKEAETSRPVGRPGLDDFAYMRPGDVELQVRAMRSIVAEVLDRNSPEYARNEGRSVYARDTVELARKLSEAQRSNDARAYLQTARFERADGGVAHGDVLNQDSWQLVRLVERDQSNSSRLQASRETQSARQRAGADTSRFSL